MSPLDTGAAPRGTETILLVDTDPQTRKLGAFMLEKRGYTVLEARSPAEALAIAQDREGVDLLLTEVLLPKMSGTELAARLTGACPALRVLYMSGADRQRIARQIETAGELSFLHKPFTMRMLAGKVRQVLDAPLTRVVGITV